MKYQAIFSVFAVVFLLAGCAPHLKVTYNSYPSGATLHLNKSTS